MFYSIACLGLKSKQFKIIFMNKVFLLQKTMGVTTQGGWGKWDYTANSTKAPDVGAGGLPESVVKSRCLRIQAFGCKSTWAAHVCSCSHSRQLFAGKLGVACTAWKGNETTGSAFTSAAHARSLARARGWVLRQSQYLSSLHPKCGTPSEAGRSLAGVWRPQWVFQTLEFTGQVFQEKFMPREL
jgi:hypothetical protein